jgi:hypothetical protein
MSARREQGEFSKQEKDFMDEFAPEYMVTFYSGNQQSGKGDKKEWIYSNVYPKYVERFHSDGPNGPTADSLRAVSNLFLPSSVMIVTSI